MNKGFNCRNLDTFVDDLTATTGNIYIMGPDSYPTPRNGVNVGYPTTSSVQDRDRNSGLDPRLAGSHFNGADFPAVLRIELEAAGTYGIIAAFGDAYGGGQPSGVINVYDDATLLFSINHPTGFATGTHQWRDANDVLRSSADTTWLDSVQRTETFATTICQIALGTSPSQIGYISHFRLVTVGGAPAPPPRRLLLGVG